MPVTPTYPGVYIEELPSMSHSVTPAPTSVTVFVGYTHPFKTKTFNTAVEIFSFTDYQNNFGGFFDLGDWLPDYVGNAVSQFFQNGGGDAWVIGLKTTGFVDASGTPVKNAQGNPATLSAAAMTLDMSAAGAAAGTVTVTLDALEPGGTDPTTNAASGTVTQVQLANRRQSDAAASQNYDTADIIITHGTTAETYRAVAAANIATVLASVSAGICHDQPGGRDPGAVSRPAAGQRRPCLYRRAAGELDPGQPGRLQRRCSSPARPSMST